MAGLGCAAQDRTVRRLLGEGLGPGLDRGGGAFDHLGQRSDGPVARGPRRLSRPTSSVTPAAAPAANVRIGPTVSATCSDGTPWPRIAEAALSSIGR